MSVNLGKSNSKSNQSSDVLSPDEVSAYFDKINELSGGNLSNFAKGNNAFTGLSPDQIKSLGGLGATRTNQITSERDRVNSDYGADSSLSVAQKLRAQQLNNNSANSNLDAIAKETEAAITGLANSNEINKAKFRREDLSALADIFFGGKGQRSQGSSSSSSTQVGAGL